MSDFRLLKIYRKHYNRSWKDVSVPEIRLEGKWLAKLGFEAGEYIQVEQLEQKLIITLHRDNNSAGSDS